MNMLKMVWMVSCAAVCVSMASAQLERPGKRQLVAPIVVTGNARMDFLANVGALEFPASMPMLPESFGAEQKSPLLAGALSLAIPGAGEFYTGSYWRAGGFLLVETGLWVYYASYNSKGDKQTTLFQTYADAHWSVVRYADWVSANASKLNPAVTGFTDYLIPGTENRPPWERVDWAKLNAVENLIAQVSGNGFTHQLPLRPQQQYYELIGKYPEFASGWDDAGIMTPERIIKSEVSQRFLDYSHMRGKANDFYNIASTGAALLIVNHLVSALDAAWSAWQFNNRLKLEAHLEPIVRSPEFTEFVPTARLTICF